MANIVEDKLHNGEDRPTSPLDAIKQFCIECFGYQQRVVKNCSSTKCPLYCFRDGHNPYRKAKEYTEEEMELLKQRIANARSAKS